MPLILKVANDLKSDIASDENYSVLAFCLYLLKANLVTNKKFYEYF